MMTDIPKSYQRVTVELKQEHIDRGVRKSTYSCPIAIALIEQIRLKSVFVNGPTNELILDGHFARLNFLLSDNAQSFLTRFDRGLPVDPISFSIFFPLDNP